jgi:modulator of FtsH protease HflC
MNRIVALVIVVVLLLFAGASTLVVVDQRHVAIVYSRGQADPTVVGPGLHFKLPTPLQAAARMDMRIQTVDAGNPDRYTTSDKSDLLVSPLLKYRVVEPLKLFAATGGDLQSAPERLSALAREALADALGKRTLTDTLSHQTQIAASAREAMANGARSLGIDVVDLQLVRVDFAGNMSDTVYKRMAAEREQAASAARADGSAQAEAIKADADRQRQTVLADAYKQAQTIKGQGDAKAAEIAAEAFSRDPGFYQFYQSMQAYRAVFKPNDVIVVDPDSQFFRFMRSSGGNADAATRAEAAPKKH